jgi:hypothetical protein
MTRLKRHRAPRRQWVCHARALPGAAPLKPIPLHPQRDRAGPPKRGKPTAPKLFRGTCRSRGTRKTPDAESDDVGSMDQGLHAS